MDYVSETMRAENLSKLDIGKAAGQAGQAENLMKPDIRSGSTPSCLLAKVSISARFGPSLCLRMVRSRARHAESQRCGNVSTFDHYKGLTYSSLGIFEI